MANVNKILLPRRGKKSAMESPSKAAMILAKGEFFVECTDAGVGKGPIKIKIGDGITAYSSLPYALGDTSNDTVSFAESTDTTIAEVLSKIVSGASLGTIVSSVKKGISLLDTSLTQTNNRLDNITDTNKITEVKIVTSLPPDAAIHDTTLYLILSE